MQVHYDGKGSVFDEAFYQKLVKCYRKFDDYNLYDSQIKGWRKINRYWLTRNTNKSPKGGIDTWCGGGDWKGGHGFNEFRSRASESFGSDKMVVCEPCNYVSNVAYYHSVVKICDYADNWSVSTET